MALVGMSCNERLTGAMHRKLAEGEIVRGQKIRNGNPQPHCVKEPVFLSLGPLSCPCPSRMWGTVDNAERDRQTSLVPLRRNSCANNNANRMTPAVSRLRPSSRGLYAPHFNPPRCRPFFPSSTESTLVSIIDYSTYSLFRLGSVLYGDPQSEAGSDG